MRHLTNLNFQHEEMSFPALDMAWENGSSAPGLLAVGGDLCVERLKLAYQRGIFPWFGMDDPILWWSPDPRMVLYPQNFKISHSLRKTLRKFIRSSPQHQIKIDTDFKQVIQNCACAQRSGQNGTWILPGMVEAYTQLHENGLAHSFETWVNDELVGGLYGVNLGGMFYGESMFAKCSDASKLALCGLIAFARAHGIALIDCQQKTRHLSSLGGDVIPRSQFEQEMKKAQSLPSISWQTGQLPPTFWAQLEI